MALLGFAMLTGAEFALSEDADHVAQPTVKIMTSFYPMYIATINVTKVWKVSRL